MNNQPGILAIDQGTTSSRAIIFNSNMEIANIEQQEFSQYFPNSGWVEHDPEEIWQSVLNVCTTAIANTTLAVKAIGITNQRETVVVWDATTGTAIYNAIVWQDRRTAELCERLKADNIEPMVREKTGLLIDAYFSATKVHWILENVNGARQAAAHGTLRFGTIDTFLIWRLTAGKTYATDSTNAARTMLYNIHSREWDDELLALFNIPHSMLPTVHPCAANFGTTRQFGMQLPIIAVAGDQQAASIGQSCFVPGMVKSTYGTGCFVLLNTGKTPLQSANRMLTTIAYDIEGEFAYALEGSIFVAGAVIQWLRDGIKVLENASQSEALAMQAKQSAVVFVPAFTGLGAPYWDSNARGAILGLTRDSGIAEITHAALQAIAFQSRDLLDAMRKDWNATTEFSLRVDGAMVANNWLLQTLADITQITVDRPKIIETTALGVAWIAGMKIGIYPTMREISQHWQRDQQFVPQLASQQADALYARWKQAVARILTN